MKPQLSSLGAAILLGSGLCVGQGSSTVSLSNGVELKVAAKLGQPTGLENLTIEMSRASGDSFYRIFRDQNKLVVFAYELEVSRAGTGATFGITAKPVMTEFAARFPNADAGKPVPSLSSDHNLGPLRSGEHAELGLFEIPGMGLQVSDTVEVRVNPDGGGAGALRFGGLKVSINGKFVSGAAPRTPVSGRYLMFYIPGQGGYFFATDPPAGRPFLKAGSIDRNHMQFTVDNTTFDCVTDAPILKSGESSEIWVYHDPAYQPSGNWTLDLRAASTRAGSEEFFTAASDSLNWWFQ